ncbi:unnamed protein product [Umbelopsis vinacea]
MKKESRSVAVFAKGVAACSHQAKAYGQCITARYTDVHRDVCAKEFQAFKTSEPYDPYVPTAANPPGAQNAKTTKVRQEVDQVINIMQDNIDRVVDRGANLSQLQSKTDDLQATTGQFRRSAVQVRKRMWWKDMKWRIVIVFTVLVIIGIIVGKYMKNPGTEAYPTTYKWMNFFRSKPFRKLEDEEGSTTVLFDNNEADDIELNDGLGASTIICNRGAISIGGNAAAWSSISNLSSDRPARQRRRQRFTPADIRNPLKKTLYLLLEDPSSSSAAFWTNVFVSMMIVLSALTTTIETIPAFRSAESNRSWFNLETVMVVMFTLEYLLRFFAHSDSFRMLGRFMIAPLSIIDFVSIVPYYIELLAKRDTTYEFRFTILRLFRLLRLFKSYKYSNTIVMTIEVMMVALRRSGDALSALFFFLVTSLVLFSTLLYFAERGIWDATLETFVDSSGNPSSFDSIPAAFWFVLVTITTTGYGDMVPTTFIALVYTNAKIHTRFGVLQLIALPSIIIGRNFTIVWEAMRNYQMTHNGELPESMEDPTAGGTRSPDRRNSFIDDIPHFPAMPSTNRSMDQNNLRLAEQVSALSEMTRQNQVAIERILKILQASHPSNRGDSLAPMTKAEYSGSGTPNDVTNLGSEKETGPETEGQDFT